MSSQFYITLPSNTEANNTASNFTVKLAQRLRLDGDWEVALVEIIYPNSWFTMDNQENFIKIQTFTGIYTMSLNVGYYETIYEFIKMLNKILKKKKQKIVELDVEFEYDESEHKVKLCLNSNNIRGIYVSQKVADLLGFYEPILYHIEAQNDEFSVISDANICRNGDFTPDFSSDFSMFYVYCSIVGNQIVGNTMAPLLRIVDVQGKHRDVINKTYVSPHYVSILTKDISAIEINIKNDMNEFLVFHFGKVVIKLHFRKRLTYFE